MTRQVDTKKGLGNVQFLASLMVIALVGYVLFQLSYPFYAFQRLEDTMQEWVEINVHGSRVDDNEILLEVRWIIERYKIPLDPEAIKVEYDQERRVLAVYADYDVYVEFPGYTHHYHFEPYAEAEGG